MISSSQCQAIIQVYCELENPKTPYECLNNGNLFCQVPSNGCQGATEYLCKFAPAASLDACIVNGEQVCLENNGKSNGKGWGKGKGNGKGNDRGELSCSQCQALTEDLCGFTSSKDCNLEGNLLCQLTCNQCQEFTEDLCSYPGTDLPPAEFETCVANGEQVCLDNTGNGKGKGNGKGWGKGKGNGK